MIQLELAVWTKSPMNSAQVLLMQRLYSPECSEVVTVLLQECAADQSFLLRLLQLILSAQRELTAQAAASEYQHVDTITLCSCPNISVSVCVSVHYSPFFLFHPTPPLRRSFFSGCSKLEGGPGFSALSESSVSDDTASSCTGLSVEGRRG